MIDEKKLIEDIKEWSKEREIKWSSESVISLLESAPKIGEWIPCSERLPENISTVIVQVSEIEKPTFGWYADMDKKWILSEKDFVDLEKFTVIAWQPLPKTYQPKGE